MGVTMPNLNKFTLNSNFPSIVKSGVTSQTFSIPSMTATVSQQAIYTATMSVADSEIIFPVLEKNGVSYPTRVLSFDYDNGNANQYVILKQNSPTVVQLEVGAGVFSGSRTFPAFTLKVSLNRFKMI